MEEWDEDHGPTDYCNIIEICGTHHMFVHEGGWKIEGDPDGELTFVRPDGSRFTGRAPQPKASVVESVTKSATTALAANTETFRQQEMNQQEERAIEDLASQFDHDEMLGVKLVDQNLDRTGSPLVAEQAPPEPSWGDDPRAA